MGCRRPRCLPCLCPRLLGRPRRSGQPPALHPPHRRCRRLPPQYRQCLPRPSTWSRRFRCFRRRCSQPCPSSQRSPAFRLTRSSLRSLWSPLTPAFRQCSTCRPTRCRCHRTRGPRIPAGRWRAARNAVTREPDSQEDAQAIVASRDHLFLRRTICESATRRGQLAGANPKTRLWCERLGNPSEGSRSLPEKRSRNFRARGPPGGRAGRGGG